MLLITLINIREMEQGDETKTTQQHKTVSQLLRVLKKTSHFHYTNSIKLQVTQGN